MIGHLGDRRFLTLWSLYREILNGGGDGDVRNIILATDGTECGDKEISISLKRFMALVANRKLREKVFGF